MVIRSMERAPRAGPDRAGRLLLMDDGNGEDELFVTVLRRWRELGGIIAAGEFRGPKVVEEGDEIAIREQPWVLLAPGDETEAHLKAFDSGVTRVLDATFGKPGRDGIESWGDWEIYVDRVDKTGSCANWTLVDLAYHRLMGEEGETTKVQQEDGTVEDRVAIMMDARSFMQPADTSWNAVLEKMANNLEVYKFGAEDTAPECVVAYEDDGNTRCFLVDAGPCMYICCMETS
jgi:hypothetical protein